MCKLIGRAGVVLISWMVGTGCLWADQTTPQDSWAQKAETFIGQTFEGGGISNIGGSGTPTGSKSSSIKIKRNGGSKKTSKMKKTKKKGSKAPKKSKGRKSRKKSKSAN
jgi:hypothetical protein